MGTDSRNRNMELGDFLKVRRGKIKPEQVGLPAGSRRRTPGLRREEVAQLAGIGLTWYTWLEQGREINVSEAVLDSLSRVFMLTGEERSHLYTLAGRTSREENDADAFPPVTDTLTHILHSLDMAGCPAYMMDHRWNILAWNQCSTAVFGDFGLLPEDERNVVYLMFCTPSYMRLFDDWEYHAKGVLARFRRTMAKHMDDAWFAVFVEVLKEKSDAFASWWSLYDVDGMSPVVKELTHSDAGKLTFDFVSFDVSEHPGLRMLVHQPDQGTLEKMKRLIENI